ncbi:hypothetical protein MHU86_17273 [Fragilaria crotonensis]|nr:hypothetical protein MHU86_17273 [Fragilaria crotonensis]
MFMMRQAAAARHSNTAIAVWRPSQRFLSTSIEHEFGEEPISKTTQSTTVHSSLSYGPIDYARGWAWQQTLLHQRLLRRAKLLQQPQESVDDDLQDDTILLFEHLPVYTLGRGADESHITVEIPDRDRLSRTCRRQRGSGSARLSMDKSPLSSTTMTTADSVQHLSEMATPVIAPNGVPIYRIDRGGEVTFHGPGQLVVYPLLDLKRCPMQQDLHWYLRQIEQVIIDTLHDYDIPTTRDSDHTGVWYQSPNHRNNKGDNGRFAKVAAVGVSASRWITTHGFALNVRPTLQYFDASYIVPCGIHDKDVTSMEQIWREEGRETELPTVDQVAASVLNKMESVFGITVEKNAIIKIH